MNVKEEYDAAVKEAQGIVNAAKDAVRELTSEEADQVAGLITKAGGLNDKLKNAEKSADLLKRLGELNTPADETPDTKGDARDLAEHFIKSGAFDRMKASKGDRFSVSAPEFKAATDPAVTTGLTQTQYGQVVPTRLRRLTIADLLSSGTMSATSLTYWTQGTVTGAFTTVAEGGTKPSLNFAFAAVTENLSKIAGLTRITEEMSEDASYIESVIRSQLLLRMGIFEEDQILNGNGTAPNVRGILNRSGVQTETGATIADNMDAIFRAATKVQTGAFLPADGVVIHPTDYQTLRLKKDSALQYLGGGPFTGAYGNGTGVEMQPGLWGLPTVVTPAIAVGTVLVGAFAAGAQLFRKGGIRVDSTNSNEDDFKKNLIMLRAEERVALAVYIPTAFVVLTLGTT